MSDYLKPCPFCKRLEARVLHVRDGRKVACACGACGPVMYHAGKDDPDASTRAMTSWNTRAEYTALSEDTAIAEAFREVNGPYGALIHNDFVVDYITQRSKELFAHSGESVRLDEVFGWFVETLPPKTYQCLFTQAPEIVAMQGSVERGEVKATPLYTRQSMLVVSKLIEALRKTKTCALSTEVRDVVNAALQSANSEGVQNREAELALVDQVLTKHCEAISTDAALEIVETLRAKPVVTEQCPACNRAWTEHRMGYSASQCKAKPPKPVVDALEALKIAHKHLDMDALKISHCNDAAKIIAVLESKPVVSDEMVDAATDAFYDHYDGPESIVRECIREALTVALGVKS